MLHACDMTRSHRLPLRPVVKSQYTVGTKLAQLILSGKHYITCHCIGLWADRVPYRILSWGGKQQDDSSTFRTLTHKCACLLGGSGGIPPPPPPPQEFRSSQIVSNAIWDKIFACDKTIITILNFKISGGGLEFLPPPPCMKPWQRNMR